MEPTNEELARSFEEAAAAAERGADQLEIAALKGYSFIGLDEPVEDVVRSQREYARPMRSNAEAARALRG